MCIFRGHIYLYGYLRNIFYTNLLYMAMVLREIIPKTSSDGTIRVAVLSHYLCSLLFSDGTALFKYTENGFVSSDVEL